MYRRYTNVNREGAPLNQIKQIRIRDVIIVLLLAAVVFLTIRTITDLNSQGEEKTLYIRKINSEYNLATEKMAGLRGDYTQELAEIRGHLYAIKTLNDMYLIKEKQVLIPDEKLEQCISIIKEYFKDDATGGRNLTTVLSNLRIAMDQLQEAINELE